MLGDVHEKKCATGQNYVSLQLKDMKRTLSYNHPHMKTNKLLILVYAVVVIDFEAYTILPLTVGLLCFTSALTILRWYHYAVVLIGRITGLVRPSVLR